MLASTIGPSSFPKVIPVKVIFVHPYGSNWMGVGKDITTIFNLMPPIGMLSIAAFLESSGIDVEIIDCYAAPHARRKHALRRSSPGSRTWSASPAPPRRSWRDTASPRC